MEKILMTTSDNGLIYSALRLLMHSIFTSFPIISLSFQFYFERFSCYCVPLFLVSAPPHNMRVNNTLLLHYFRENFIFSVFNLF